MSYIPHSLDFYVDVFCLGWLFALGFRSFDLIVWEAKFIFSSIKEIISDIKSRKHPKN